MVGTAMATVRTAPAVTRSEPDIRDYPWVVYVVIALVCFGLTVFASTDYVRSIVEHMFQ